MASAALRMAAAADPSTPASSGLSPKEEGELEDGEISDDDNSRSRSSSSSSSGGGLLPYPRRRLLVLLVVLPAAAEEFLTLTAPGRAGPAQGTQQLPTQRTVPDSPAPRADAVGVPVGKQPPAVLLGAEPHRPGPFPLSRQQALPGWESLESGARSGGARRQAGVQTSWRRRIRRSGIRIRQQPELARTLSTPQELQKLWKISIKKTESLIQKRELCGRNF